MTNVPEIAGLAELGDLARAWHRESRRAVAVRAIGAEGLGPRSTGDVLLVDADARSAGRLLGGAVDAEAVRAALELLGSGAAIASDVVRVDVGEADATSAGLTCGGAVELLLQRLDVIPTVLWDRVGRGEPVALVTADASIGSPGSVSAPVVVTTGPELAGTFGDAELDRWAAAEGERALRVPGASVRRGRCGAVDLVVEAWNPVPRLLLVGSSDLSRALVRQAELLGWEGRTVDGSDAALAELGALGATDAVVVIDHDPDVATPVLAAALARRVGYVGALGSRRTQASRREQLSRTELPAEDLDRLHGPTGLDIGAGTTAESAVSIVAEIIASRTGRGGGSLRVAVGRISR